MSITSIKLDRRGFLKTSGAMTVYFALGACNSQSNATEKARNENTNSNITVSNWLRLTASGEVHLSLGKVELGQGIGTALAQIAAESLRVDFDRISLLPVDTAGSPDEAYTFSSISVQQSAPKIQAAALAAYQALCQRAANQLGVNLSDVSANDGVISASGEVTDITFWNILAGQEQIISAEEVAANEASTPTPKEAPTTHQVLGQTIPRIDLPAKIFGGEAFIQDMRLPDMLHARLVRPPAPRATLDDFNIDKVVGLPGYVDTIRDGNFVAVVAQRENQARKIADTLSRHLSWSVPGDLPKQSGLYDWVRNTRSKTY